ncbi:gamma-glutamyltransferase [Flexibacterium corallicola]|uniref:gamma-glutamyltransferase n=1 Tax=Flexibacterium corallicola TaxID=3037259 RepID=UPI00286F5F9A|nr:gamma-glutamyltransferase [Pseudovibrio sp. M1P-2-3]
MTRNFHFAGRSPVYAKNAMAASSHPFATYAALEILKEGGNAADAAIAAASVLSVVEPHMTGIGGDCFALIAKPDGTLHGINASGRAAQNASSEKLRMRGYTEITADSVEAITVPGALRGWEKLSNDHGSMEFGRLLQRAIGYARDGFPVSSRTAWDWKRHHDLLLRNKVTRETYLIDERPPKSGEVMAFPALANTLDTLAIKGVDAFYHGRIAEEIEELIQSAGGEITANDLAQMQATDVLPITTEYKGLTVAELPPNGQGIIALVMLELMKRFDMSDLDPLGGERFHLEMEIAKLAYSSRDYFFADPDHMAFDAKKLLETEYIDKLAERINRRSVLPRLSHQFLSPSSDTAYLSVVDKNGMAVSLINSLYQGFGSGFITPHSGVLLHCRGACFSLEKGHPNELSGGKRPLHTIIPAMALQNGVPALCFGVMGGGYQPCGHAHVLANLLEYGMDIQESIDLPRMFIDEKTLALQAEEGIPLKTIEYLEGLGHTVNRVQVPLGGGQGILINQDTCVLTGGSDPRKDGFALGY